MPWSKIHSLSPPVWTFLTLLVVMLVVASAQLFVLPGFTDTVLGVPVWVWLHLVVLFILGALAWIATDRIVRPEVA